MKTSIHDALTILNITEMPVTQEIVKRAYQVAAMKHHPDRNPASHEIMQMVNVAYDVLKHCKELEKIKIDVATAKDYGDAVNQALNAIIHLDGLKIEICGSWVWVTGNTKTHKDILKAAGFQWGRTKKTWYYRPAEWRSKNRKPWSMDQIREAYGSEAYQAKDENKKLPVAA